MAKIARCVQIAFTPIIEEKSDSKRKSCEFVCADKTNKPCIFFNVKERDFTASDFMVNKEVNPSLISKLDGLVTDFKDQK